MSRFFNNSFNDCWRLRASLHNGGNYVRSLWSDVGTKCVLTYRAIWAAASVITQDGIEGNMVWG